MNLKILIYCTKEKSRLGYLCKEKNGRYYITADNGNSLNGKIVAECDYLLEDIFGYIDENNEPYYEVFSFFEILHEEWLTRVSCLNHDELVKYLGEYKGLVGYAIHIKNLHIFDKPKELSDFYKVEETFGIEPARHLIKAPQNMCYTFDCYGNKYVVMSIQPQWVCLILNELKDVEVRRKVLKEMKPCE